MYLLHKQIVFVLHKSVSCDAQRYCRRCSCIQGCSVFSFRSCMFRKNTLYYDASPPPPNQPWSSQNKRYLQTLCMEHGLNIAFRLRPGICSLCCFFPLFYVIESFPFCIFSLFIHFIVFVYHFSVRH